mmetsp:Transcript_4654/g.5351  ORF Transcript_4654/g.5351 Transcript_4654/m.5351 type:complete len:299 (+) Transcript_4654:58-954(+)
MNARNTPTIVSSLEEKRALLMKKVELLVAERKRKRALAKQHQNSSGLSLSDISFSEPFSEEESFLRAQNINIIPSFEDRRAIRMNKSTTLLSSMEERRRILMKKVEHMAAERKRKKFWSRRHPKSSWSESDFSFSFSEDGSYLHSITSPKKGSPSLEEKRSMLMDKVESMVAERNRQRAWQKNLHASGCLSLSDFSCSEVSNDSNVSTSSEEDDYKEATMSLHRSTQEVPQSDLSSVSAHEREEIPEDAETIGDWCSYDDSNLSSSYISGLTPIDSMDSLLSCPQEIIVQPSRWRGDS